MTKFSFTGDLDIIRPRQLEFISEVLEKRGFTGPEAKIENVGLAGENYMSTIKRITVKENGKTFKIIAKVASDNDAMRAMSQAAMLFKNEEVIYSELLPKFVQIQKSAGVEPYRYPEFYGALDEEKNEIILLEDLKESQFSIQDRFKELSEDCMKMVIKTLAIYHSMSYVVKYQEPEFFNEIKSKLGDMYNGPGWQTEEGKNYVKTLEESILTLLSDEHKKYVKGSCQDLMKVYQKTTKRDIGSKHSVIQQGDGWISNIMFRIKDGVPEECILIDYQLAKESNPAFDIIYTIFNSTSHEQRMKNYYDYLDLYHRELDNSLNNYGLKASLVYPRDQLDSDLKRFAKFMFTICVLVSNTILKNNEEAEKLKEVMNSADMMSNESAAAVFNVSPESAALFGDKVEGLVDSFVAFGYL